MIASMTRADRVHDLVGRVHDLVDRVRDRVRGLALAQPSRTRPDATPGTGTCWGSCSTCAAVEDETAGCDLQARWWV